MVAEDSLRYLLDLPEGAPSIEDVVAQRPLAEYTAQYWWQHMHESNNMYNQKLLDLVLQFLTNSRCLLLWVQFYNLEIDFGGRNLSIPLEKLAPPLYYAAFLGLSGVVNSFLE